MAVGAGCLPDLDREGLVKDLRILGIRAEPAELVDAPLPNDLRAQARDRLQRIARQRAARWNVLLEQ